MSAYFYEHSNIKERDDCISMAIKKNALIEDANDAYVFRNSYMKIFICKLSKYFLHFNAKFEWDIVLSSSHDGWDKKCGTPCVMSQRKHFYPSKLRLIVSKVVQTQQTWMLWVTTFKVWTYYIRAIFTNGLVEYNVNIFSDNKCIT